MRTLLGVPSRVRLTVDAEVSPSLFLRRGVEGSDLVAVRDAEAFAGDVSRCGFVVFQAVSVVVVVVVGVDLADRRHGLDDEVDDEVAVAAGADLLLVQWLLEAPDDVTGEAGIER